MTTDAIPNLERGNILEAICAHLKIRPEAVRGSTQDPKVVDARHLIAQTMREFGYSQPQIGRALGNRDRSSVRLYLDPAYRDKKRARQHQRRIAKGA